jgi:hypothetical protein
MTPESPVIPGSPRAAVPPPPPLTLDSFIGKLGDPGRYQVNKFPRSINDTADTKPPLYRLMISSFLPNFSAISKPNVQRFNHVVKGPRRIV